MLAFNMRQDFYQTKSELWQKKLLLCWSSYKTSLQGWLNASVCCSIYRGYYTAVRRYEFYLRVVKTIFYERAQRVSKILFSPREDKIRRVMFCLLYSREQVKIQVSNINFRSIMVKTWLYFN